MIKTVICSILLTLSIITTAQATDYKLAVPGAIASPAGKAAASFEAQLTDLKTDASLSVLPGVFPVKEYLQLLETGDLDFVVIPFEAVPELSSSALLNSFMAKTAVEVRQAINSDVGANDIATMEKKGYRVLDIWHVSSSIFSSKQPVQNVEALQGLKVRVQPGLQSQTFAQLGASPQAVPASEVFAALSAGSIDSSPLPIANLNIGLGLYELVDNYVDRTYRPQLYAVMIKNERWEELPFPDQYHLAKAAKNVGEALVEPLDNLAAQFRIDAKAKGAQFSNWNSEDLQQVRLASLASIDPEALVQRSLVNRAFETAAATPAPPPDGETIPASEVNLLFVTDRKKADLKQPETAFSAGRILRGHNFGNATVTLKGNRKLGSNLEKTTTIKSLDLKTQQQFETLLDQSNGKDVVVFVHGYNNAFTDSIRRGATIQQDIKQDALVISYTWPSDGTVLSYAYDESSTEITIQNFKLFMDMLTSKIAADRIHIIAHSMGSRLVTEYVANLPERSRFPNTTKFKNIVFAAPDIATLFFQQKEEEPFDLDYPLSAYADRITIYSSKDDMPLGLSQKIHKDQRLGLADPTTIYLDADLIAIDASLIDPKKFLHNFTFATRHSYVFDKAAGVRDLSALLAGIDPTDRTGMSEQSRGGLKFWKLSP